MESWSDRVAKAKEQMLRNTNRYFGRPEPEPEPERYVGRRWNRPSVWPDRSGEDANTWARWYGSYDEFARRSVEVDNWVMPTPSEHAVAPRGRLYAIEAGRIATQVINSGGIRREQYTLHRAPGGWTITAMDFAKEATPEHLRDDRDGEE